MAFDLEQHLKQICEEHQPKLDLYERLMQVRASADEIWKEQRLKWFTDHRASTHSKYIIEHLGDVIIHLQKTPQRLTPHELYVLLVACYLHDIGMQDFQMGDGRGVESFTEADYKHIRKNHPQRARELIIDRALWRGRDEFDIKIADDDYLVPIALVSQGHGSAFFSETVEELRHIPHRPGNMPLRGDLLTALLLMGDELDLHRRRAVFLKEFALSPTSLLHNHIHHYVASVEIVDGNIPKHRHIRVTMNYPQDSDSYRIYVNKWIGNKLRKQCELTRLIIEGATQGEISWDSQIEIIETIDKYNSQRPLPDSAFAELQQEILDEQSVDRKEMLKALQITIEQSVHHFQGIQIIDQEYSDWSYLVRWLKSICACEHVTCVHLGFQQRIGRSPKDILELLSNKFQEKKVCNCSNYISKKASVSEYRPEALTQYGQALLDDLKGRTDSSPLVMILESVDQAESDTIQWLGTWLLPELKNQDISLLVVLTQFNDNSTKDLSAQWQAFRLPPFTKEQISHHLQEGLGFSPRDADHEAAGMLDLSGGNPSNIYTYLERRRQKSIAVIAG